ncbi:MAG: hypothetical protein KIT45_07585 [Fimbriimonadia bacterium]|nr:hypothetical protein [Fimbriimonadia bacterium]
MHKTTSRFWSDLSKLPKHIQDLAKQNFDILKENPMHPSLYFKQIGEFWSVRIGINYRALAVKEEEDFIWVWIRIHDDYLRFIRNR